MAQDRKYVVINPPGANQQELNNWQVLRSLVDAVNAGSLTQLFPTVSLSTAHEDLTDMPSKTNDDHDERYIVEIAATAPTDPVNGKLWLDTSVTPIVLKVYDEGTLSWVVSADLDTVLKLDQTTPQTVSNGMPVFAGGLDFADQQLLSDMVVVDGGTGQLGIGTLTPTGAFDVVSMGYNSNVFSIYDKNTLVPLANVNQGGSGNANLILSSITGVIGVLLGGTLRAYSRSGFNAGFRGVLPATSYKAIASANGIEVIDTVAPTLGAEVLTNGALTSGTSWTAVGDVALVNNRAEFVYSTGNSTYIDQPSASLATPLVANAWYVLQYDITDYVGVPGYLNPTISVFVTAQLFQESVFNATANKVYFKNGTTTTRVRIQVTNMVAGHSFNLDNLSLKQITSGGSITSPADFTVDVPSGKTLVLGNPAYEDIQFAISAGKVPAANYPDYTTFTTNTQEFAFGVDEYIDLSANELAHWWKEGTNYEPHIHCAIKTAQNTGSNRYAKFQIYVAYAYTGDVWTETNFTAELTIPTGSAALKAFYLSFSSQTTFSAKTIGTQVKVRVKRIAATGGTEYADDVFITQVGMHTSVDTMGSRTLSAK